MVEPTEADNEARDQLWKDILWILNGESKSARQVSNETGHSLAMTYRGIRGLETNKRIRVSNVILSKDGNRIKLYKAVA